MLDCAALSRPMKWNVLKEEFVESSSNMSDLQLNPSLMKGYTMHRFGQWVL